MKFAPKHLKSFWNKKNILFVSLSLIFLIGIGGTLAWLTGYDGSVDYEFQGAFVACSVDEHWDGAVKSNVRIQNTGNVDAYFRATYTANWVKDGTQNSATPVIYWDSPKLGTDYTVSLNSQWASYGDGYYYWIESDVAPEEYSPVFIQNLTDSGTAPEGYHLQVNVIAEAIQSTNDANEPGFWNTWGTTFQTAQSRPEKAG